MQKNLYHTYSAFVLRITSWEKTTLLTAVPIKTVVLNEREIAIENKAR